MILIAAYSAATHFNIKGRTSKPFNPLLGETYDLITQDFTFFAEMVSHHPPVVALNGKGNGWYVESRNFKTM